MEGKNIPLVIMLLAGSAVSIACIVYRFSLLHTLLFVFFTLVVFYLLGHIVRKIVLRINQDAETRAALLAKEQEEDFEEAEGKEYTAYTSFADEEAEEEEEQQEDGFTVS